MNLWIAPHNDDETLFGAFTLMREHPLVVIVTDSWKQYNRGDGITCEDRWRETIAAMRILECPVIRLGIRDDVLDEWMVREKLSRFNLFTKVYAPAIQGGNVDHDIIGNVAESLFSAILTPYMTYSATELYTTGSREIKPTSEELQTKERALMCYTTQFTQPRTKPHFEAIRGKSEWYI